MSASNIENKLKLAYNPKSAQSILEHGEKLLGHSLRELHPDAKIFKGKGGLGDSVEYYHYGYEPNSKPEPDFDEAGLELKCTPLKLLKDKSMVSKERLVLNIINYIEEADKQFETSSFWHKNKFLLLMFYLHQSGVDPVDMLFKLIRTWEFPEEDLKIIRDDWNKIHSLIVNGKADELSEGLTFYLAACMKGSKSGENMRKQPFSETLAQQRAYSLKQGYINKIILSSYLDVNLKHQLNISEKKVKSLQTKYFSDSIVKSLKAYKKGETFEELIERKMQPFYGKTINQLSEEFGTHFNISKKDVAYDVCRAIFRVNTKKIQEFENAEVSLKTITLEAKRDYVVQSMSFPYFRFLDIVNQEWEESDWYKTLNSKFFFVVFRKSPNGKPDEAKLEKAFFWNMPLSDMKFAEFLWSDTKNKIMNGDYSHFLTKTSTENVDKGNKVCHVRPHGTKGHTVPTPQGTNEQPKCFWLNNDYILEIVKPHLN
jgi:DNA mismatch repair protein MutH